MRVTRREPPAGRTVRQAEQRRAFGAALERARRRTGDGPGAIAEPSVRRGGGEVQGVRSARRVHRAVEGDTGEKGAAPGPMAAGAPQSPAPHAEVPALPELREAARAIPVAVWAGRVAAAPALELSFGRDLAVELRQGAGGIELTVRAAAPLVRAAQVDLPALVRALARHGVGVLRAEVRGAPEAGGGRAPAGVDARAPLR